MARTRTASDQLVERLVEWGIDVVFGLPGDGINGVMEARGRIATRSASSTSATRKLPRSLPAPTGNSRAVLPPAWRPRLPAPCT